MKNLNLQDVFLNQVRKERTTVTIYLTNGFQFRGVVKGFDNYIIVLTATASRISSTSTPCPPLSRPGRFPS